MKDLGEIKEYLGRNVDYDYHKCDMKLSQSKYIESLANQINYKIINFTALQWKQT